MNDAATAQPPQDVAAHVIELARTARAASHVIAVASTASKNRALDAIADALRARADDILAWTISSRRARPRRRPARPARTRSGPHHRDGDGVHEVAELPDPIGAIDDLTIGPAASRWAHAGPARCRRHHLIRPNDADAAALCLKSGNAAVLRGGSEAQASNLAIAACVRAGLERAGLPAAAVQVLGTPDRAAVGVMLTQHAYIDVIVPRGGKGLIERVSREARMPVIKHLDGVCHVFIDDDADADKALRIALNAKTQRYGTCNTMETLLATPASAARVFPALFAAYRAAGVELRGCARTRALDAAVAPASEDDWYAEYLGPVLAVRIVDDLEAAIAHIRQYGSQHTDAIVTENFARARRFLTAVDSSSVMVNASTRFADGYEYGLGAEIGISTDKFHARGPVGLEGLTSQKWIVLGDGHIRE